jgi:alpha-tubulin suppressor-like RCC1 family protein
MATALALLGCAGRDPPAPAPPRRAAKLPVCHDAPRVELRLPAAEIASGQGHTCAVGPAGQVHCWGANHHGQLGDGTRDRRTAPVAASIADAAQIAASRDSTCAVTRAGEVRCWGRHFDAAPRTIAGLDRVRRLALSGSVGCTVHAGGSVSCWGIQVPDSVHRHVIPPTPIPEVSDAVDVALGDAGVCVLHACGRVSCAGSPWGRDPRDYRLWLALPLQEQKDVPDAVQIVSAGSEWSRPRICALRASGEVLCWAPHVSAPSAPVRVAEASDLVSLWGGAATCGQRRDGRIACWDLGLWDPDAPASSDEDRRSLPRVDVADVPAARSLAVGYAWRCATRESGRVSCWGFLLGGETGLVVAAASVPELRDAADLSAGAVHTCAVTRAGDVVCAGPRGLTNGLGDPGGGWSIANPGPIEGLHGMARVAAGDGFACALHARGEIFCWGRDDAGQLGDGPHHQDRLLPQPVVAIRDAVGLSAARRHACAVRRGGEVMCWGASPGGREDASPAPVRGVAGAVEVSAGDSEACARLRSGGVICWSGGGARTIAGAGDAVALASGAAHTCARLRSGLLACWRAGEARATPVPGLADVIDVDAGGDETCAVTRAGRITCWGRDEPERRRPWEAVGEAVRVTTSGDHACAGLASGAVVCWGDNRFGQTGTPAYAVRFPPTDMLGMP